MLGGLGNLGNMAGMLKQAMAMKDKMKEVKASLGDEQVEASAGGGMVSVVMNGNFEVVSISIEPEVVEPGEVEMLETLVRAAVNESIQKVQEMIKTRVQEVTGELGLDIPGLT